MSRQFLTDTDAASDVKVERDPLQMASEELVQFSANQTMDEILAGAFPEWDLVPATPFVRRVK